MSCPISLGIVLTVSVPSLLLEEVGQATTIYKDFTAKPSFDHAERFDKFEKNFRLFHSVFRFVKSDQHLVAAQEARDPRGIVTGKFG